MEHPQLQRLADLLLDHSCAIARGENILIEAFDLPDPRLVCLLVEGAAARGAIPVVNWKNNEILRSLYKVGTEPSLSLCGQIEASVMEKMQAYIGIRGSNNGSEFADVPGDRMSLFQKHWWQAVHSTIRVPKTRWVVLRYPTGSFAQAANMSTSAFEEFFFRVCTADYAQMHKDQQPLIRRMTDANQIRITGPGTDLRFSVENIPVIPCYGKRNIPDGEVFTAPVKTSVEGHITYNAPSRYQGVVFDNVAFEFEKGRIVKATAAGNTQRINEILDSDEGARFIGEWSIGCNNEIRRPMLDTLFDEKIGGSLHFTPGQAYEEADNGNRSCVHWDLVLIQTPEYGGGSIYFDGELIRQDGRFTTPDLQGLNRGL